MDQKVAFRHITKRVPIEKAHVSLSPLALPAPIFLDQLTRQTWCGKQLTYRLLSRELGITVTQSKEWAHLSLYIPVDWLGTDSTKIRLLRLLASYLQEPSAKERGVSAVYLLSGFLTRNPAIENGKNGHNEDEQGMDVAGRDEPTSTQENETKEVFRTRTVMLVTSEELKG